MKIVCIAIGKKHDAMFEEAIGDYSGRIGRHIPLEWRFIPASDARREAESFAKMVDQLSSPYVVVLDERGKEYSTQELVDFVEKRMVAGEKTVVFAIGGAFGWDQSVRDTAQTVWSLSRLTMPHQLVRVVMTEALARALSVIKGEPYHHA